MSQTILFIQSFLRLLFLEMEREEGEVRVRGRVIVAGDSAVGKTTLIRFLTDREGDDVAYDVSRPAASLTFDGNIVDVYDIGRDVL